MSEDDNESSGTSPLLGGPVGEFADEDDESEDGPGTEESGVGEGNPDEGAESERRRPEPSQTDGPTLRQARESSVVDEQESGASESAPEWPDEETGEQDGEGTDSTRVGLGLQMPDDEGDDEPPASDETPVPDQTPAPGGPSVGGDGVGGADTPAPDEDGEDDREQSDSPKGFGVVNPPGGSSEKDSEDDEEDLNEESSGVLGFDGVRSGPDSEADDSSNPPDRSDS